MTIYLSNRDGDGKTNEEGHYRLLSRVLSGQVLEPTDLQVTENSPLGLSVLVNPGDYRLEVPAGYAYQGWIDSAASVTITTPDSSNPRITVIVLYVDKSATTSAAPPNNPGIAKLMAVNGSPSSTPTTPSDAAIQTAVGASNPFMKLAAVRVGAAVTQITNSNITDLREEITLNDSILSPTSILQAVGPLIYPVGSIYSNATSGTNPATLIGFGTWVAYGQGRVTVGIDTSDTSFNTPGKTGGTKTETLNESQIPSHYHTGVTDAQGNHTHSATRDVVVTSGSGTNRTYLAGSGQQLAWNGAFGLNYSGLHAHNFITNPTGGGQSHNNLQPYIVVYMWLRVA